MNTLTTIPNTRTAQIAAVYGSGLRQGIALIIFPAADPLLTNCEEQK